MSNFKLAGMLAVLSAGLSAQSNPVVDWNRRLLEIVRTPGAQSATIHSTRNFAILHAAIYDAVNRIDGTHQPYSTLAAGGFPPSRAPEVEAVAAATAAHAVLVALYPSFRDALDADFQRALSAVSAAPLVAEGVAAGEAAAAQLLSMRSSDGSAVAAPAFVYGANPGDYQSTPPNFPKPAFTTWAQVTPFVLASASQFRPPAPPALSTSAYAADIDEVKSLGIANGTAATAGQMLTGFFWNGAIQDYWNEIAQSAALAHHLGTPETARLFALLNLAFADTAIAFYDTKYTYQRWRPVTAIRAAGTADWLPEVSNTPADPSYPGAHAAISAAGAAILSTVLGTDQFGLPVTSESMAGASRSFPSFSAIAEEATLSRIYAGVHTRLDEAAGTQLGTSVAQYTITRILLPVR